MPQKARTDLLVQREAQDFDRMMTAARAKRSTSAPVPSRHPAVRLSQRLHTLQERTFARRSR